MVKSQDYYFFFTCWYTPFQQLRLAPGPQGSSGRFWSGSTCLHPADADPGAVLSSACLESLPQTGRLTRATQRKVMRGNRENGHKNPVNFPFCTPGENNSSPPSRLQHLWQILSVFRILSNVEEVSVKFRGEERKGQAEARKRAQTKSFTH